MKNSKKSSSTLLASLTLSFSLSLALYLAECFYFFQQDLWSKYPRHLNSFFAGWGILFIFALAFNHFGFLLVLFFISILSLLQWFHLSYFGTFLHPNAIYLFFVNISEVTQTAQSHLPKVVLPFVLICLLLFYFKYKISHFQRNLGHWPWLKWILFFSMIYAPVRTYVTGHTFGKQPVIRELSFVNTYSSFSYFFGKILPAKLSRPITTHNISDLKKTQIIQPQRHIVLLMGESLRFKNMSLYGYARETTPHMKELYTSLNQPSGHGQQMIFSIRKAYSGGVSTDVSLPLFFNASQGESLPTLLTQKRCLFALAEKQGYETHFISAQTEISLQHIINYLCPKFISDLQVGTEELTGSDENLLHALDKIDFAKPQFLVLHQRGSHSPYNMRYPPQHKVFKENSGDTHEEMQIKHYDNSVHFTDEIWFQILQTLKTKSRLPFDFIFTSDHGQALGENKVWGHVMLNEEVIQIPFLFLSQSPDSFSMTVQTWPEWIHHQKISQFLIERMGYEIDPSEKIQTFDILGPDLDGLDGYWRFDFNQIPPRRVN